MSGFTGYVPSTDANNGQSAFQFNAFVPGTVFRLTGTEFLNRIVGYDENNQPIYQLDKDGKKVAVPGFKTSLGDPIRLTELYRPIADENNQAHVKDNAFTRELQNLLIAGRGKSTEEVLRSVVEHFKDTDIKVLSATPIRCKDQQGKPYTTTFRIYGYVD